MLMLDSMFPSEHVRCVAHQAETDGVEHCYAEATGFNERVAQCDQKCKNGRGFYTIQGEVVDASPARD